MRHDFVRACAAATLVLASCMPFAPPASPGTSQSGHAAGWMDRSGAEFHGQPVKEAGYDFTRAKWAGIACSVCHAGTDPKQASPVAKAPSCFACHAGGPTGRPGHPPGFMNQTSPDFHGVVVKAAGYDYTKAFAGTLACSACHAGESPTQVSPNSRAPSCFFCHTGGPTGGPGHPVGWAITPALLFSGYAGPAPCVSCHGSLPSPRPEWRGPATLSFGSERYTGVAAPVEVTVTDPDSDRDRNRIEAISLDVSSRAEPAGETVSLVESTAGSGYFVGAFMLERLFGDDGNLVATGSNGKLAIYAEGGVATDSISASYGGLAGTVTYAEPPSTVTGIVRVGGVPSGGSSVQLSSDGPFRRATVSRSDGAFAFHDVPPGTYTIVAARNGARQLTSTVVVP